MDVAALILDAVRREVSRQLRGAREVTWGTVTQASPLRVRLRGDTGDVPVVAVDGFTATLGARVVLVKVGSRLWAVGERA